jgi:hypothetical protein
MGKYGTNLEGFGAFEGGVNADKGAPLVSTSSDGETALLFGPAALREIQAGVANGDFFIPPDAAGDTITAENPLPYWTFTDDDSAGAITCKVVTADAGNSILWTVAAGTPTGKTATLSRYVAVPSTQDRAYAFYPEFYVASTTNATSRNIIFTLQYYTAAFVTTGTAITRTYPFSDFTSSGASAVFLSSDTSSRLTVPTNARFAKISIQVDTTGTNASESTLSLSEVKMLTAYPMLLIADRFDGGNRGPASIWKGNNKLIISFGIPTNWTSGDLSTTDNNIEITSSLITLRGASRVTGTFEALNNITATGDITAGGANSNLLARVTATATQSLTNNTATKLTFNTASSTPTTDSYDPQAWFDNANDQIIIGQAGFYTISANVGFATNATGRRLVQIYVNGSDRGGVQVAALSGATTILSASTNVYLAVNDYVEVFALQQSGGALNTVSVTGVYPALSVGRIGA